MRSSGMPVDAAEVAAPIRKLWLLKDEPLRVGVKMERSQWLTITGVSGQPVEVTNRGPGAWPRRSR